MKLALESSGRYLFDATHYITPSESHSLIWQFLNNWWPNYKTCRGLKVRNLVQCSQPSGVNEIIKYKKQLLSYSLCVCVAIRDGGGMADTLQMWAFCPEWKMAYSIGWDGPQQIIILYQGVFIAGQADSHEAVDDQCCDGSAYTTVSAHDTWLSISCGHPELIDYWIRNDFHFNSAAVTASAPCRFHVNETDQEHRPFLNSTKSNPRAHPYLNVVTYVWICAAVSSWAWLRP